MDDLAALPGFRSYRPERTFNVLNDKATSGGKTYNTTFVFPHSRNVRYRPSSPSSRSVVVPVVPVVTSLVSILKVYPHQEEMQREKRHTSPPIPHDGVTTAATPDPTSTTRPQGRQQPSTQSGSWRIPQPSTSHQPHQSTVEQPDPRHETGAPRSPTWITSSQTSQTRWQPPAWTSPKRSVTVVDQQSVVTVLAT
jgi:hypothetical protein